MGRRERRRDGKPPKQVNPLKSAHCLCLDGLPPSWIEETFTDTSKPFIIDIGCGEGEWLVEAATNCSAYNYLGVEIRLEAILVAARKCGDDSVVINHASVSRPSGTTSRAHSNIGFMHANLLAGDLHAILTDLRRRCCSIHVMAVQFPDPHWKGKHKKRRILTQSLLFTAASHLAEGGMFYVQSDVRDVVSDVTSMLIRTPLHGDTNETQKADNDTDANGPLDFPEFGWRSVLSIQAVASTVCGTASLSPTEQQDQSLEYDHICQCLPSSFLNFETERASYVRRLGRPVHHLLCTVAYVAHVKRRVMSDIVSRSAAAAAAALEIISV